MAIAAHCVRWATFAKRMSKSRSSGSSTCTTRTSADLASVLRRCCTANATASSTVHRWACTPGTSIRRNGWSSSACTSSTAANCILGHICDFIGGTSYCQDSDIGVPCNGPGQCADECIGNSITGVGHCTRPCSTAADCPAGFACTNLGNQDYCVNISMYCTNGTTDCITGLCLTSDACTAYCVSAADCPVDYNCVTDGFNWFCEPPTYGAGGLGDSCASNCQSGLCMGTYCTVKCGVTRAVGQPCPPGWGCSPALNGPNYELVCVTAGTGGFGQSCSNNNQCATAACMEMSDLTMECSRFCNDGVPCPTGYSCQPMGLVASGISLSVCYR